MSLDVDPETFRRWLHGAADAVVGVHADLERLPVARWKARDLVERAFAGPLPRRGTDLERLLPDLLDELLGTSALNIGGRFFGYVISSGTQVGAVAELLQGGLNLCPSKWDLSAAGSELERAAVRWIAEFVGYPASSGGALVSGGTVANLTGLTVARTAHLGREAVHAGLPTGLEGGPNGGGRLRTYVSGEGHACHERNLDLLGLGRANLVRVEVRADRSIDPDALERRIAADRAAGHRPFCVIGSAGTTNTGAIDDLSALADVAARQGLWLHVDGAYGAPAAGTSLVGARFRGLERADSLALDPH